MQGEILIVFNFAILTSDGLRAYIRSQCIIMSPPTCSLPLFSDLVCN